MDTDTYWDANLKCWMHQTSVMIPNLKCCICGKPADYHHVHQDEKPDQGICDEHYQFAKTQHGYVAVRQWVKMNNGE